MAGFALGELQAVVPILLASVARCNVVQAVRFEQQEGCDLLLIAALLQAPLQASAGGRLPRGAARVLFGSLRANREPACRSP